jgi:hypothetical protein
LLRDTLGSNRAAADAFADKDQAGIGGWFLLPGDALQVSALHWFSISLTREDLPKWFDCQSLQSGITALEALAQIILLLMQVHFGRLPKQLVTSLPQMCDNQGVVAGSSKMLSKKLMFARTLQMLGYYCSKHGVRLQVPHLAGERNSWADALSRGKDKDPAFWALLDRDRHHDVQLKEIFAEPWLNAASCTGL